jgi:hypothetical protein
MSEKIEEEKWVYTLFKDEHGYLLKVVCGGSAMYYVKIYLNKDEVALYEKSKQFLNELAIQIRADPSKFKDRTIL